MSSEEQQQRKEKLEAVTTALDEARRDLDRAIAFGDRAIAKKLINKMQELAKECDELSDEPDAS